MSHSLHVSEVGRIKSVCAVFADLFADPDVTFAYVTFASGARPVAIGAQTLGTLLGVMSLSSGQHVFVALLCCFAVSAALVSGARPLGDLEASLQAATAPFTGAQSHTFMACVFGLSRLQTVLSLIFIAERHLGPIELQWNASAVRWGGASYSRCSCCVRGSLGATHCGERWLRKLPPPGRRGPCEWLLRSLMHAVHARVMVPRAMCALCGGVWGNMHFP